MKIVYLHQYFTTPERGGGTRSFEFARRWVDSGHEVHVIAIGPNEVGPRWQTNVVSGITVHELAIKYSNKMGFRRRLYAFAGYAVLAAKRAREIDGDVIYATSTPLTIAIPAIVASKGRATPYIFEVRDLWPDVPIALGYLENPVLRRLALGLEAAAYRNAFHVVALAPGMKFDIEAKGVDSEKVSVVPQGCDTSLFEQADPLRVRRENPWLGEGALFVYAGAIGQANGLRYLVELAQAARLEDPEAKFVVIGEGKERAELESLASDLGLLGTAIHFLGSQSKHAVADWLVGSTATMAFLTGPRVLWKDAVQNKFFDSLAARKPIVTNNDGWQTQIAQEEGVGRMLDPDDMGLAARQLMEMVRDQEFMDRVPANCERAARVRFNRDNQAELVLELLLSAAESR